MSVNERLRALPSVDSLLQHDISQQLTGQYGQVALRDAIRACLDDLRQRLLSDEDTSLDSSDLMRQVAQQLQDQFQPTLRPVINASGVILHTNLGRAPLSQSAQDAVLAMASQYNNLEYDLEQGRRGSRYVHAEELLCEVTGAQAALVVNNNASALVLILSALAKEAGVVISRGQLVEIGGGFRIPDIMAQSGARLIEVGTTNRTRIGDYEAALDEATSMLLRVHSSNFRLLGFVESAELSEMTVLAHNNDLICVDDLGSGALLDTAEYGLLHEPMVQESLSAGADVVCFSGDKLLGGPQAGIIVGRTDLITRLKKHPLARALRVDKLTYSALNATLMHYQRQDAIEQIPIWRMIARSLADIDQQAKQWAASLAADVIDGESMVGGGSLPGTTLPTRLVALNASSPDALMTRLRQCDVPVIARIVEDRVCLDPRTVLPQQEQLLLSQIKALI